jgi:hypothetical protein
MEKWEFAYKFSQEKLDECKNLTLEQRLKWLEEANDFIRTFVPKEKIIRWQKIKQGEI